MTDGVLKKALASAFAAFWAVVPLAGFGSAAEAQEPPAQIEMTSEESALEIQSRDGVEPAAVDATFSEDAEIVDYGATRPTNVIDVTDYESKPPPLIPTEQFAGRSAFQDLAISPNGDFLAVEMQVKGQGFILLVDADTREELKRYNLPAKMSVDWIKWAGNEKFLYSISRPGYFYGMALRISRIYVRLLETDDSFPLEVDNTVLWGGEAIHIAKDGSFALVSVQKDLRSNPSVYRYELEEGGKRKRIVKPKTGVWDWYADDSGVVRLGLGWKKRRLRVYYRPDGKSRFKLVGKLKEDDEASRYWSVAQIVTGSSQAYVIEEGENGRMGVRLFDYSTGQPVSTFYENPDWDIDELWLKEDGSPLAALYTDDREQIVWFEEEREKLHAELTSALKLEDVRIVDRSRENTRMVVWAGSEADPGALYIFTPGEMRLDLFSNTRPDIDFRMLSRPKPVRYTARDGLEIPAYLTLPRGRAPKDLPLIIMPHGGPFGIRDSLLYNDEVQLLANRGYAVLQPNFRGSGGYGDTFFDAGVGQVGRGMQDDLDDAMDWAVAEGFADPAKVCVVGGSYGGYAALWAVLRNPERYACAASWAGVTDWETMLEYDSKYLTRKASRVWRERIEGDEDFDLGVVSPLSFAATLSRPTLLAHGSADDNVPISQFEAFKQEASKAPVKPVTLRIAGEGHGFSKELSEKRWYDALDAFLAEHNPADQSDSIRESNPVEGLEDDSTFKKVDLPNASNNK